jgi:hypothetical protein
MRKNILNYEGLVTAYGEAGKGAGFKNDGNELLRIGKDVVRLGEARNKVGWQAIYALAGNFHFSRPRCLSI